MIIKTSTHILSLADDNVYQLRKIGAGDDDSWLESRRGEAFNRHFQVKLENNELHLYFEQKPIGTVSINNSTQVQNVVDFVRHWNLNVGPTDLVTTKTAELVRNWTQLLGARDLRVKCTTWNCAGLLADIGLKHEIWSNLIGPDSDAAGYDVIVLGFQETDNLNRSVKANTVTLQRCSEASKAYLYRTHTLASTAQLLGLMTLVFVRTPLLPFVGSIMTDTSSTGFLRMWGNKGAVLTKFTLFRDEVLGGGLQFSVVNCHLSAGEGITQLGRRRWELREIGSKFRIPGLVNSKPDSSDGYDDTELFDRDSISSMSDDDIPSEELGLDSGDPPTTDDAESDPIKEEEPVPPDTLRTNSNKYTVILGDLNYRVLLTEGEAQKKSRKQQWDGLLSHDSLSIERQGGKMFKGFEEPAIQFAPTYKYEIGTGQFKGRVPSYTDRIMYRTFCDTKVLDYTSIPNLKFSDHRPVALVTSVHIPNVIDTEKRGAVIGRAMKLSDDAENNVRPKLEVEPQQITLRGPPLSSQSEYVTIINKGTRPLQWVIEDPQDQAPLGSGESSASEPNGMDHQQQQEVLSSPGATKAAFPSREVSDSNTDSQKPSPGARKANGEEDSDIIVTPPTGNVTLTRPKSKVRLETTIDVYPRDLILVVRPQVEAEGSVQKYVFVRAEPTKSYLGSTLKAMPQVDNIPAPVRKCVEYLWPRTRPDMFLVKPDPAVFQLVLKWVDNDEPFDYEVLDSANRSVDGCSIFAVSQVLLAIFKYLPDQNQILGPSLRRKDAARDWQGIADYVFKFINHALLPPLEEQALEVWADTLYDRRDERAGRNEKRAYLRSMLIIASSTTSEAGSTSSKASSKT